MCLQVLTPTPPAILFSVCGVFQPLSDFRRPFLFLYPQPGFSASLATCWHHQGLCNSAPTSTTVIFKSATIGYTIDPECISKKSFCAILKKPEDVKFLRLLFMREVGASFRLATALALLPLVDRSPVSQSPISPLSCCRVITFGAKADILGGYITFNSGC